MMNPPERLPNHHFQFQTAFDLNRGVELHRIPQNLNMKIITITLETLWKNFMSGVADMMWCDAAFASMDDIDRVRSVILTGEEPVSTIELCRLFREAWTVTFLGDLMKEVDTIPPTPVEIHVQDGDNTYIIPNLFVVY